MTRSRPNTLLGLVIRSIQWFPLFIMIIGPTTFATLTAEAPSSAGNSNLEEHLKAFVYTLTSPEMKGRLSGSEGEIKARTYLIQQFKTVGLLPPPALDGQYEQCFMMTTQVTIPPERNHLSLINSQGQTIQLDLQKEFTPIGSSGDGHVTSPIVFAGYGITAPPYHYDDYQSLDVRGKVVLILEHEPQESDPHSQWEGTRLTYFADINDKIANAKVHGAKAVLITSDAPHHPDWQPSLSDWRRVAGAYDFGIPIAFIHPDAWQKHFPAVYEGIRQWVKETDDKGSPSTFDQNLLPQIDLSFRLNRVKTRSCNIIGILPGKKSTDKAIIIGAHYDHIGFGEIGRREPLPEPRIHPGADDNASGVAVLLETARLLGQRPPDKTILFIAFTAEERGLLGSRYYVEHPVWPLEKTMAMINLDMVGRLKNELVVFGHGSAKEWSELIKALSAPFSIRPLTEGFGPSDHTSFFIKKIPVLHLFTGGHTDQHQPTDTADKLNYHGMAQITRWLAGLIYKLDTVNQLTYQSPTGGTSVFASGPRIRIYLGTIPDYAWEGKGVRLMGVRSESPAEEAGLKAGDVVIELAGMTIQNIYDYTYALARLKSGESVTIRIRRGGQILTLKIRPRAKK